MWGCAVSEVVGICLLSPRPRPSTALDLFEEGWRSWRLRQVPPLVSGPLAPSSCTVLGAWLCSREGRTWPPSKYLHLGGILGLVNYTDISDCFRALQRYQHAFRENEVFHCIFVQTSVKIPQLTSAYFCSCVPSCL